MCALIAIPGVSVFGSQPCRAKPVGPFISIAHITNWPCSPLTFSRIQAWGFVHWNSFTVPSSWTILRASNIANEWCAEAGIATAPATTPARPRALTKPEALTILGDLRIMELLRRSPKFSGYQSLTEANHLEASHS